MYAQRLFKNVSFAALALAGATTASLLAPTPAKADDCLLDTNDNGTATATTDTDGGADSGGVNARLACGVSASATGANSSALGGSAEASGASSTAVGNNAKATGETSVAIGYQANADFDRSVAIGGDGPDADFIGARATQDGVAVGYEAKTNFGGTSVGSGASSVSNGSAFGLGADASLNAVAVGAFAFTATTDQTSASGGGLPDAPVAIGSGARAIGVRNTAVGTVARAALGSDINASSDATALGYSARADAQGAISIGSRSEATGLRAVAIGADGADTDSSGTKGARATNQDAVALGADAAATNFETTALGGRSTASGGNSFAAGAGAQATGQASLAFGSNAIANQQDATAIGGGTLAFGFASTAVGRAAAAVAPNSTAIGRDAVAGHAGATAIGVNAQTTAANQIRLGTAGNITSIPGLLTSSDAAQTGAEFFVTVDNNGTLGRGAQSSAALSQMGTQIAALQSGQALIDDQVAQLFDLRALDRKQNQRGIAAAGALAQAPFPSAPGKTSYTANSAVYRGELAFSAAISHRLDTGSPFALTAGVSHSGGRDTIARVGVAGEF